MLIPLKLKPGFSSNGTLYQNKERWVDGDRVRFYNGSIRPIGGWSRMVDNNGVPIDTIFTVDPATQISRAALGWALNDGSPIYVFGHNEGLAAISALGAVSDITPAGFSSKPSGPSAIIGYGGGFYGTGAYGVPRDVEATVDLTVFNWCFRTWGEDLIAATRWPTGEVYHWASGDPEALEIANAPDNPNCIHVTNERVLVVGGTATSPRTVIWSDTEDYTLWLSDLTNQAGDYTLEGIGKILEITTVQGQYLIVTETDAHIMRYVRPPYVYGFDKLSNNCGAVSGASVLSNERVAVWPGVRNFYIFDGSVKVLDCPVMDELIAIFNSPLGEAVVGFVNQRFNEFWWLFPSDLTGEVDSYVSLNWISQSWTIGSLYRTSGSDRLPTLRPVMIDQDGYIYEHEKDGVLPGNPEEVFIRSGPIEIGNGDSTLLIDGIIPDFEPSGELDITLFGQDMPGDELVSYGPYRVDYPKNTNYMVPARARGRQITLEARGVSGLWELGDLRLSALKGGGR